jgi:hypothetical protein
METESTEPTEANRATEAAKDEEMDQIASEAPMKKPEQTDINAITEVTNYGSFKEQKIKTVIHTEVKQFVNIPGGQDSDRIDFVLFKKGTTIAAIPDFCGESLQQFFQSRVMVISYAHTFDEHALQAAEKVVFDCDLPHDFKPVCCSLHPGRTLALSQLIWAAAEDKNFNAAKEQVLIVFDQRSEELVAAFIAHIVEKGGGANIISESLRINKLYLVYVCQSDSLFETRPAGKTHFGLYLIDPYIRAFYEQESDVRVMMAYYRTSIDTIRQTGWLSELSEDQKIDHLTRLIRSGVLEIEAGKQMQSIDRIKESKVAVELLADPLKNIVLFIQAFFEGICLSEYDELVRNLLLSMAPGEQAVKQNEALQSLLWDWNTNSDSILTGCDIYLDVAVEKKVSSYKFLMEIRENIVRDLLRSKYRMTLTRRHEAIGERLIERPLAYSRAFIDGWFRLFFETAALDPQHYLLRFGLRLADLIIDEDDGVHNPDEIKRLLIMLVNFIGAWEDDERLNPVIARFYEEMKKTADRRMLLGTIFSVHCSPERPQMLKRLKIHLESISKEEILFNLDVINSISFNYLENIPLLLETIMEWNEVETGNPLRSASHVRCAYLLLFYQQWPFQCRKGDLSYRILKQLVVTEQGLVRLAGFIFGKGIAEAFKLLHIDKYRQKYEAEPLLKSTMASHLFLMQAFVLIQWYHLLKLIRADLENAPWEVHNSLMMCIGEIAKATDMGRLKHAVGRAGSLLNYEIEEHMASPEKKNKVQLLMQKRDGARELLKLI